MSYTQGYEDGVRATKAEYLKLLKEENLHPVKELTDEEIHSIWFKNYDDFVESGLDGCVSAIHFNKFARAILRKAQEK